MQDRIHRRSQTLFGSFVALILTLAAALGGTVALTVTAAPASAASRCPASVAADQLRVVIVVDFGTEADSPGGISVECFVMASGSTGADLLRQRASSVGEPNPRYNASGLLCAIDGFPSSGCGQQSGSLYRYWSYWSGGSGNWDYGTGNPFARRLRDGDIEGWRFQAGHANPSDASPRVTPDPAGFFPVAAPPAQPSPGGGSGPGGAGAGGGVIAGPGGQVQGRSTGSPDAAPSDSTAATAEGPSDAAADDEAVQESNPDTVADSSRAGFGDTNVEASTEEAAAPPAGTSSGPPLGVLAGAGTIVALVVAATVQFRRGAQR